MNLKQQLVVKTPTDEFEIWSKKQYDEYIAGCVEYGAGSAYRIVTHFNEDENLLKDSPYQAGSAGVWVKALGSKKLALSERYNSKDFFSKKKKLKK